MRNRACKSPSLALIAFLTPIFRIGVNNPPTLAPLAAPHGAGQSVGAALPD